MLTNEQCDEFRRLPLSFNDMVRAIYEAGRASKAAEYADVPPHRFKTLYRAANNWRNNDSMPNDIFMALLIIDNGTYNQKIGGEE
jgi:hypothetical protein